MSAEAIARLRAPEQWVEHSSGRPHVLVRADDLRVLLDAYDEALGALDGLRATIRVEPTMDGAYRNAAFNYPRDDVGGWCKRADAVLAKAGHR